MASSQIHFIKHMGKTSPVSPSLDYSVVSGVSCRTPVQCSLAQKSDKMITSICSQTGLFHVPYHCKELDWLLEEPEEWQS